MPRDILDIVKESGRKLFMDRMEKAAKRRKPSRVGKNLKDIVGTLAAKRNKRLAIREAALRGVQVVLRYTKITTGETKRYTVAPYSYRYRKLKVGRRKVFYAYDMRDKHIKSFVLRNIQNVFLTDRRYRPRWPVEIT